MFEKKKVLLFTLNTTTKTNFFSAAMESFKKYLEPSQDKLLYGEIIFCDKGIKPSQLFAHNFCLLKTNCSKFMFEVCMFCFIFMLDFEEFCGFMTFVWSR